MLKCCSGDGWGSLIFGNSYNSNWMGEMKSNPQAPSIKRAETKTQREAEKEEGVILENPDTWGREKMEE